MWARKSIRIVLLPSVMSVEDSRMNRLRLASLNCKSSKMQKRPGLFTKFNNRISQYIFPQMYRARLKGFGQVWWFLFLLLLAACLQNSHKPDQSSLADPCTFPTWDPVVPPCIRTAAAICPYSELGRGVAAKMQARDTKVCKYWMPAREEGRGEEYWCTFGWLASLSTR